MKKARHTFQTLFALSALLLLLINDQSFGSTNDSYDFCHSAYEKWLSTYGSSDPFLAVQKTTPWPLLPDVLTQLNQAEIKISASDLEGFGFPTEKVKQQAKASFLSSLREVGTLLPRDLAIRQNLKSFLDATKSEKHQLSLAYVGLAHSIDLFLTFPKTGATYVNKPFSLKTLTISSGQRELQNHLKMLSPPLTVGEAALSYYVLPYFYAAQTLRSSNSGRLPENTLAQGHSDKNRIVISEFHGFDSTKWITHLPSAECLHTMGIKKINLALEGYAVGRSFTTENILERRTFIEQFNYRAKKLGISTDEFMDRLKLPTSLREKIRSGDVEDNPAIPALIRKLIQYRSKGIILNLQGLEATNYNELEGT